MNPIVENYTASDNGTHVIIKQIFVTMDPREYVRWDDLLNVVLFYSLLYFSITLCCNMYKKKKREREATPATAIVVNAEDGVRVLNVSTE